VRERERKPHRKRVEKKNKKGQKEKGAKKRKMREKGGEGAYLAILCVSANDNVKHTKSNIGYDNKINKMK